MDGTTAMIVQQVLDWLSNVGKFVVENVGALLCGRFISMVLWIY